MGKHTATEDDAELVDVARTVDRTIVSWLTPDRRKALYALAAAVLAVMVALGVIEQDAATKWLDVVSQLGGVLVLLVATLHTGGTYVAPVEPPVTEAPADEVPGAEEASAGDA